MPAYRKFLVIIASLLILAACSPKNEIQLETENELQQNALGRNSGHQGSKPLPGVSEGIERIFCESNTSLLLTNSKASELSRGKSFFFTDLIKSSIKKPELLAATKNTMDVLVSSIDTGNSYPPEIFFISVDPLYKKVLQSFRWQFPQVPAWWKNILSRLGNLQPKYYVASPSGQEFLLAKENSYEIFRSNNPENSIEKLTLSPQTVFSPRWTKQFLFWNVLDNSSSNLRQAFHKIHDRKIGDFVYLPAPILVDADQIGLMASSDGTLYWLEWTESRSILRRWNLEANLLNQYETSNFGKGIRPLLTITKNNLGEFLVLATEKGISFLRLDNDRNLLPYGEIIYTDFMKNSSNSFSGARELFVGPNAQTLYAVVPEKDGNYLFVIDNMKIFRRITQFSCEHASIQEEFVQ